MKRLSILLLALLVGCAAQSMSTTTTPTTTTTLPVTTTTTSMTTTTSQGAPPPTSTVQMLDPATLEPLGASFEIPGHLSSNAVELPDQRIVFSSLQEPDVGRFWLSVVHPDTGRVDSAELSGPASSPLGYSGHLGGVVFVTRTADTLHTSLFDPEEMTVTENAPFVEEASWWAHESALFDDGRKMAFYNAPGYDTEYVGEPPQVRILDLETNVLGDPITVEGVVHGHTELAEEFIRQASFPYGEVEPGIAFDTSAGRLYVAHADGEGLTVANLLSGEVDVVPLRAQPSFWGRALSWLIPPADAKGSEPSATISAWLSPDGTRLFVTGETYDAWREADQRLHTKTEALGLVVVDTETLEVARVLELPVSRGLSTASALALTGSTGDQIWCDEVCSPGNNEPTVEGESEATGLYILDPTTLEITEQLRPGVFYWFMYPFEHWIITETETPDGWGYESIDTRTGDVGAYLPATGDWSLLVTDAGVFEVEWPIIAG